MRAGEQKRIYSVWLIWVPAVVFFVGSCAVKEPAPCETAKEPAEKVAEKAAEEAPKEVAEVVEEVTVAESAIVAKACSSVYKGDFSAAGELISRAGPERNVAFVELAKIVEQYQAIEQRRAEQRKTLYQEQLAKLEELQSAAESNDVNDFASVFLVIAEAQEYADERQEKQLLDEPFVKRVVAKAKRKAAEYEAKGQWLDAYTNCYSWLKKIYEENKDYSDYAEQLKDKILIRASLQDSPCESRKQRYENINKKMLIRASKVLEFNYVSIVDYQEMSKEAIERCKLLADVLAAGDSSESMDVVTEAKWKLPDDVLDTGDSSESLDVVIDANKVSTWRAGLEAIRADVTESLIGVNKDKFVSYFKDVLALNSVTIKLPEEALIAQFAEAAMSALDPYTTVIWPRQVQNFEKDLTNEFTGIGIEISKKEGFLKVVSLLPDTPAYVSGLDAGDVIEAVDGVSTKDMSLRCAVVKITGPAGTKVTLTIRHPGEDNSLDITIERAKISVPSVRGWQRTGQGKWRYMVDEEKRIGYVRITDFLEKTPAELEEVIQQLEAKGLKGLILDLRTNQGGLLGSAIATADKFIKEGLIVSTRPRFGRWNYQPAHEKGTHPNYPMVVLINRYSASGSEIVAGALQDPSHNRAILVGERSYGKGSVQTIVKYPGGGAQLKYTMAYYYLPSGRKVKSHYAREKLGKKDWGIAPDVEVILRPDEMKKKSDVEKDNSVLVKAGHDNEAAPLKRHTIEETLGADPQLAVGVLILKSRLIEEAEKLKATSAKL